MSMSNVLQRCPMDGKGDDRESDDSDEWVRWMEKIDLYHTDMCSSVGPILYQMAF